MRGDLSDMSHQITHDIVKEFKKKKVRRTYVSRQQFIPTHVINCLRPRIYKKCTKSSFTVLCTSQSRLKSFPIFRSVHISGNQVGYQLSSPMVRIKGTKSQQSQKKSKDMMMVVWLRMMNSNIIICSPISDMCLTIFHDAVLAGPKKKNAETSIHVPNVKLPVGLHVV